MRKNKPDSKVIPLPLPGQPPAVAPAKPKPPVVVETYLSEADRWFAAIALSKMPWSGGEQVVMLLHGIHTKLKLFEINRDKEYAKCTLASSLYKLDRPELELLIGAICNANFVAEAGPTMAKLVMRLRAAVDKAVAARDAKAKG